VVVVGWLMTGTAAAAGRVFPKMVTAKLDDGIILSASPLTGKPKF
jgi:hypothetical protein